MTNRIMVLTISLLLAIVTSNINTLAQNPNNNNPCPVDVKGDEVIFTSINAIRSNSRYDNFKIKYKIEKAGSDNFQILLTFYTNVRNIQYANGFCYTLYDASGKSYPLYIKNLGGVTFGTSRDTDTSSSFYMDCWILQNVSLNIKKSALSSVARNGLAKIKFQIKNTSGKALTGQISCCLPPDWHYIGYSADLGSGNYLEWKINSTDKVNFKNYVAKILK